jgi:hypothetical protein
MAAWVLIVSLGSTSSFAVSGIASEQACKELHAKIAGTYTVGAPTMHCLEYQAAAK